MLTAKNGKIVVYTDNATRKDYMTFDALLDYLPVQSHTGFTGVWRVTRSKKYIKAYTIFQVNGGSLDQTDNVSLSVIFPRENPKNFRVAYCNRQSRRLAEKHCVTGDVYDKLSDVYVNLP